MISWCCCNYISIPIFNNMMQHENHISSKQRPTMTRRTSKIAGVGIWGNLAELFCAPVGDEMLPVQSWQKSWAMRSIVASNGWTLLTSFNDPNNQSPKSIQKPSNIWKILKADITLVQRCKKDAWPTLVACFWVFTLCSYYRLCNHPCLISLRERDGKCCRPWPWC